MFREDIFLYNCLQYFRTTTDFTSTGFPGQPPLRKENTEDTEDTYPSINLAEYNREYNSSGSSDSEDAVEDAEEEDPIDPAAVPQPQGCVSSFLNGKLATDKNILELRTRYRNKLGWFFWFRPIKRYDTTMRKW